MSILRSNRLSQSHDVARQPTWVASSLSDFSSRVGSISPIPSVASRCGDAPISGHLPISLLTKPRAGALRVATLRVLQSESGNRAVQRLIALPLITRNERVQRQDGHPHYRPALEEQHVGFARYAAEEGWIYIDGPSGAGGHGLTERGLDGLAYNVRMDRLEIVEQKGISRARRVGLGDKPTAVTTNLRRNLDDMIALVTRMVDLPNQPRILTLLQQTRAALDGGATVPANVRVVVTSARGTGVTRGLSQYWRSRGVQLPVEFESTAVRPVPRTSQAGGGPVTPEEPTTATLRPGSSGLAIASTVLSAASFAVQLMPPGAGGFALGNVQFRYTREQPGPREIVEREYPILNIGSIKGFGASYAFLQLVLRFDGNNIISAYTRSHRISGYEGGLLGSEARVTFSAVQVSGPQDAVTQAYLLFDGFNNPSGPGFQRFRGRILVTGDGQVEPAGGALTTQDGFIRNWLSGFEIGWD